MILTTFNGESVYLLPYRPNWAIKPSATFSMLTVEQRSLQGIEARRAYGPTLRTALNFTAYLRGDQSTDFRVGLQRLQNLRVLCPFWPTAALFSDPFAPVYTDAFGNWYTSPSGSVYTTTGVAPALKSGLWFTFEQDMSHWEVHTTSAPSSFTPSANAIRVPLMIGYFKTPPAPKAITSNLLSAPIQFMESGPAAYALMPVVGDGINGLTLPTGITPKIFPLTPNWASQPDAGQATIEVTREQIGFGRELAETYYPQSAARALTLKFSQFTWQGIGALVDFFSKRKGTVESFWLPGALDECALAAPTSTNSPVVSVDRALGLGDNRFLMFVTGSTVEMHAAISVNTSANTLTLDSSPTRVYNPVQTRISSAILCRFQKPELRVDFTTDRIADASVSFVETPNEYQVQVGETTGATAGALPGRAWLFRFIRKMPGLDIIDRFTSYEADVNLNGEVFAKKPISHDKVSDALDPQQTGVSIKTRAFVGNPLMLVMPNQLEAPLLMQILEVTPDASGAATTSYLRFYGRIQNVRFKGPIITADATHILQDLERVAPRYQKQPTCNYKLYGQACGRSMAATTSSGTIVGQSGTQLTLSGLSFSAAGAGYFAQGKLWSGAGANYQTRGILDSTPVNAGQITITLKKSLSPLPGGSVLFVPGCAKTADACKNKFNNYPRFGGTPFVPVGNPTLVKVADTNTGAKK